MRITSRQITTLAAALTLLECAVAVPLRAQSSGRILGRVIEAETRRPVSTAEVQVVGLELSTITSERGDFLFENVPIGEHRLRAERIGLRPGVVPILVRPSRTTQVTIELSAAPIELEEVTAEIERTRLIEPDVTVIHEVTLGRELRELPVDEVAEAVELTTGVNEGHFRGGRVGQETYRIDGLDVKNQLGASTEGPIIEVSPSALAEIEVVTGGFGAETGSALSGVVSYVTRRGNPERWEGRTAILTDHFLPDGAFRGFSSLSASLGGPLNFLGSGTTVFADLLAQGKVDSDPRARGLTCLQKDDGDEALASAINDLSTNPVTAHLYCPYTESRLPYQRGDKLIGFLRIDRPLSASTNLTASLLHNRRQNELYTQEFKYNTENQLGRRTKSTLLSLRLDWTKHRLGRAYRVTLRGAGLRLDRYLGAVEPGTFTERNRFAGFGLSDFRFLGEEFVKSPIEEQLAAGTAVPGYEQPGGTTGSPFGPAAAGIFFTEGTPEIAAWSESEFIGGDLVGEILTSEGHAVRGGATARFYEIENYERVLADLPGSSPNFARFYPALATGFAELSLLAAHDITVRLGFRVEGFRSGLDFQPDRSDILGPRIDTKWETKLLPRLAVAAPVPRTDGRTMFRFSYGQVAQPPDFQFFLDTAIGDSLRTDIRRQGNPRLAFERGSAWEVGVSHLLSDRIAVGATVFLKELTNLVTGSLRFIGFAENQFTTGDFGSVKGIELTLRARWPWLQVRGGYALQEAKGVTSSPLGEPIGGRTDMRIEFPLGFDRRHAIDLTVLAGRAAGAADQNWSGSLTSSIQSGFPLFRDPGDLQTAVDADLEFERLPWTYLVNARLSREMGALPGCGGCALRLILEARNLFNRDNVIALRRDTGTVAPSVDDLSATAQEVPDDLEPIPRESPDYSELVDLNRDGLITASELQVARFAAALDREDPSLFFGQDFQLRFGLEVTF